MSYASIEDLRERLGGQSSEPSPEYRAKMLHALPPYTVVDRVAFILKHCEGKRVVEFGASGPMTTEIQKVAAAYKGWDKNASAGVVACDFDDTDARELPGGGDPEIIVCGEVLEHLGNPLHFLRLLRKEYPGVGVIITVPNAFAKGQAGWLAKGFENVNLDHCSWYSPKTLSVLLERAGYRVGQLFFYNGDGPTAEGLIVACE